MYRSLPRSGPLPLLLDRKALLLAVYLAFDWQAIVHRVSSLGFSPALVFYVGLFALLTAALFAAAFVPGKWHRIALATILAAGSVALHSYEWTTASPLTYSAFETMLASRNDAGSAFAQYGFELLQACGAALVLFVAIVLPPRDKQLPLKAHWVLPLGALVLLITILYFRGGEGSRALPAPFTPLAHGSIKLGLTIASPSGVRQPVTINPVTRAPDGDIVLIVDESIAANYLDINHPAGAYSGLAGPRDGLEISNFGISSSVTNCSAGSNKSLRFGGTSENFREMAERGPSVWAFANRAGYRTVYLDGQRLDGELQNLADEAERAEIDDFVQLGPEVEVVDRDHELARLLAERLSNGVREFIYVNKVGAHFPVADKFHLETARYFPLPERGLTADIIDLGPVHGSHRGTQEEWRLYRNAYRNTLEWSVGGFFDILLPRAAGTGAVIVYTGDHGQDMHERGNPGRGTHCTNDPLAEEGAVPLVVIDQAQDMRMDWEASASALRDGARHARVFPTMLAMMGYQPDPATSPYGPALDVLEPDQLAFTTDWFALLGREPVWRPFTRDDLVAPNPDDHLPLDQ